VLALADGLAARRRLKAQRAAEAAQRAAIRGVLEPKRVVDDVITGYADALAARVVLDLRSSRRQEGVT
jgi:hypothetical protein